MGKVRRGQFDRPVGSVLAHKTVFNRLYRVRFPDPCSQFLFDPFPVVRMHRQPGTGADQVRRFPSEPFFDVGALVQDHAFEIVDSHHIRDVRDHRFLLDVVVPDEAVRVEEFEGHFYRGVQDGDARVFDDITVGRDFFDFLDYFGFGLVGEENDRNVTLGQDFSGCFRTVSTVSEIDVHEHEIDRGVLAEQVEGLVARIGDRYRIAVFLERHLFGQRNDYFIFHQEKPFLCPVTHAM